MDTINKSKCSFLNCLRGAYMKLEKGKISSLQFIFLAIAYCLGDTLIISIGEQANQDAWLAILAALGEGIFFAIIYIALAMKFPNKTLIQFNDIIFGSFLGKAISIIYIFYFIQVSSFVLRNFGDFFSTSLPETPMVVFLIALTLICSSAVRNGIEVITRCCFILIPVASFYVLFTFILLLKDFEIAHFLPVFELPLKDFFTVSHFIASIPFGEAVALLMVIPFVNNQKKVRKSIVMALIITGIILLINASQNIAVLGVTKAIYYYPSYQATRLIHIADILTGLEFLIAINFLLLGFLKISVFYYGTVLGISQLFRLRTYQPLTLPIGAIIILFSIVSFENSIESNYFYKNFYPYYALILQFSIPLLSLIVAMVRGLPKKE